MDPKGVECYTGLSSAYKLKFPFSLHFIQQLEAHKSLYKEDTERLLRESGNASLSTQELERQQSKFISSVAPLLAGHGDLFAEYLIKLFLGWLL